MSNQSENAGNQDEQKSKKPAGKFSRLTKFSRSHFSF